MDTKDLLAEIEAHLAKTGESASRFGYFAINDPNFVFDLRQGRQPRSQTVERVIERIRSSA